MSEYGTDGAFRREVRALSFLILLLMVFGVATAIDPPAAQAQPPAPVADVGPAEAEDIPSARATARLQDRRIEALSERTETTTTWVNPDGTRTTEFNGGPIRVRQNDAWVPVDLRLQRYDDGSVRPQAHPRDLVIAGAGGAAGTPRDLASVQAPEGRVALQYPGVLPEPVLEGTSVLYPEVQPGVDLRVSATRTGFEQFFIVKQRPTQPLNLTLPVRAEGLTTRVDVDGNTELLSPAGAVVGSVPAATMWDARVNPASGDPLQVVRVPGAVEAVAPLARDGLTPLNGVDVDVAVDLGYFADPALVYPVTVDPGVTIHTNFDTFTQSGVTTDQSGSTELRIGSPDNGATKARSYLHFDVSALRGHQVLSADLRLSATFSPTCEARNWEVWDTALVSTSTRWTNQPAPGTRWTTTNTTLGNPPGCPDGPTSTNVQSLIQSWANRSVTTGSMLLKAENESDSLAYKKFSSAQGASSPHLVVTYNRIPDVAGALDVTDRGDHQGTVFTRSLTPTLSFTPRDPDGDVVSVVFYVYDGNAMIHDEWVHNIASGSVARWQVPPGMLADGKEYRFRVTTMDATRAFADDAWVRLRSVQTGQVADVAGCGITNGTPVMQAPNNNTDCQRFFPWGTGDGFHHFRVRHSGQVLDNSGCGTGEGNPVATFDQTGTDCQKWAIERFGNGEYKFAVKNSNKVLDQGCTTGNVQLTVKDRRTDGCQFWALDMAPNNGATVRWLTVNTDTTLPGAPFVTSTDYPSDQNWHRGTGQAGSFRFTSAANLSPPIAYVYGLDSTPTTEVTPGTGAAGTTDAVVSLTPNGDGRHVLNVRTKDRAGNLSGVTSYAFNVGRAGLLRPGDGERSPARVPITISGQPAMDNVKFFWRRGPGTTAYAAIPVAHLRRADGTPLSNVSAQGFVATSSISGGLYWAANETLGSAAGGIEIRAEFSEVREGTTPYITPWRAVVVDPNADGAASTDIAGGELNLLTGDFTQHTTDVEEFGLSVSRSTSSRDPRAGYQAQRERLTPNQQQLITDTVGFTSVMADITRVTNGGYESNESLRVTPKASGSMGADTFSSIEGDNGAMRLGMRPGRIYRVTGWIYVPGATGLNPTDVDGLKIVAFTNGGTTGGRRYASNLPTAMDTWQELRVDIAVPADATSAYIRLYNGFNVGSGKHVFFDNLSVRELHAPFGPQWRGGTSVDADGIDYNRLTVAGSVVRLEGVDGRGIWFTKGNGGSFFPEPGAEHLRLSFAGSTYTLNEIDGTVTTFTQNTPGGAWTVASTTPPTVQAQTRYVYEDVDDQSRIRRVIAPPEVGVGDCNAPTPARGCEVLEYEYATTRTANPTALGDIVGQVSRVWAWTTNPGNGAMERIEIVRYVYDDAGRLREVWDPRLATPIKTTYAYDADGRVIEMSGSGELPWYFDHGVAGVGDPNAGRLLRVRRAALRPGTLDVPDGEIATTVVYNVPLTRAAGGPHDLDGPAVAQWSQKSVPTDATALFGPEDPAAVNTATTTAPGPDGNRAATIHYLDPAGREINTATPGGYIDTSEFDRFGNEIRTLDATNRELALGRLPGGDALLSQLGLAQMDPPTRATWLDERSTYSGDGIDELTSINELQRLALDGDPTQLVNARGETSTTYDEGKPDGFNYHLPTTVRSGARVVGVAELRDVQVTRTGYGPELGGLPGWSQRIATSTVLDAEGPTGSAVTMRTKLDDRGRSRESRRIDANGTDAGTTIAVFYTAGNNPDDAACGNRPEWAGNACVTRPGGNVTGHDGARMPNALPTKRVLSYTRFGEADRITETAPGHERTTVTTFDSADRVTGVEITGLGEAVPRTTTTYDPVTGDSVATRFPDGTQVTRGIVEVQDLMPIAIAHDPDHRQRLVRRVVNVRGTVGMRSEIAPRPDYGRGRADAQVIDGGLWFTGTDHALGLGATVDLDGAGTAEFSLAEGETALFVLGVHDVDAEPPRALRPDDVDALFDATVAFWRDWLTTSTYTGRWRERVQRSAITLKLLTHEPSGAIVAAPTMGLPEQLGGARNWDYRYVWLRDAAFSLYALLRLGFTAEAAAFVDWLTDRFTQHPDDEPRDDGPGPLRVMYAIDGDPPPPETELAHLRGYRDSRPVLVGNGAGEQLQLDVYGELIDSIYLFDKYGNGISHGDWENLCVVIDWLRKNWDQPDEGIWETRAGRGDHVFSRLMCWVALERMIRMARRRGLPGDLTGWTTTRDDIYRQIMDRGWDAERETFVQRYDASTLDASVLLMPMVKFVAPTEPRFLSTLDAITRELVVDTLVFRYDVTDAPDGLDGDEGTFSMCSFWYVEALTRAGRLADARIALEKMFTYANHLGLYAEEIGLTGDHLGNFPQAFTHLSLISAAINLDRALG